MATYSSFLSEDQFTCSICLELYTNPVSTPCGHNFCKACITRHWAGKEQHQCPLCNDKFSKGLKVSVNTELKEIVEKFRNHRVNIDSTSAIKPGQVPCDCCPDSKVRASKTCLVCLVSFCDAHLEPHRRVAAFKTHKLTHPVHKLEEKICKSHNQIFTFFCRSDQTRACALCTEHDHHDTVHLEEAYVNKSTRIGKKREDGEETKQNKVKAIKAATQSIKKGKGRGKTTSVKTNQLVAPNTSSHRRGVPQHTRSCIPLNTDASGGIRVYEVHVEGRTGWELAVVSGSVRQRTRFPLNHGDVIWSIKADKNMYTEKILVNVDYTNGLLFFFDADNCVIMYFTRCNFNESLQLIFNPGQAATLGQILQRDIRKISEQKDAFFRIILLIVVTICFLCCLCAERP